MSAQKSGRFEILDGYPADVVAVSAHGRIDRAAYEQTLIPLIEKTVKTEGKANLFYRIGEDFTGFSAGAAWDDAWVGLMHLGDFVRIAVVTDVEWIRLGIKLFAPLMRGRVRLFRLDEADEAGDWIRTDVPSAPPGPMVAADHKIDAR